MCWRINDDSRFCCPDFSLPTAVTTGLKFFVKLQNDLKPFSGGAKSASMKVTVLLWEFQVRVRPTFRKLGWFKGWTVISSVNIQILLWLFAYTCQEQTPESWGDRRGSQFLSVYWSHKTQLWYVSPSDPLNCDLSGSSPCPLNGHVHWNTGWGLASTIWTNTSAEEFWLSPFPKWSLHCARKRSAKASGIALNLRGLWTVLC